MSDIRIDYGLISQLFIEDNPTNSEITFDDAFIFKSLHQGDFIIASYEPYHTRYRIPLERYLMGLKEKERDIKLNQLL